MNSKRNLLKFIPLAIIVCFSAFLLFNNTPTHAAGKTKKMASFSVHKNLQGATLTKDYYFFVGCNGSYGSGGCQIIRCARSSSFIKSCKKHATSSSVGHKISSLYYKWNAQAIQAAVKDGSGNFNKSCYNFSLKKVSSGCGSFVSSSGLSPGSSGLRQGWTKYKSADGKTYYFRGYGISSSTIYLYNSKKNVIKKWSPPVGGEIEDVMVDGDTGEVYFAMAHQWSSMNFYKTTVFSKWIKATGSSSSESGGSNRGKNPYINREPSNPISDIANKTKNEGVVDTNFFGALQDDGKGCGIWLILNIILTVLTSGVIIAATIGMLLSAITYMTAKDNPEKIVKAKKRILDIIIGLFIYAAMWSILEWLLPGGVLNTGEICQPATTTSADDTNGTSEEEDAQ